MPAIQRVRMAGLLKKTVNRAAGRFDTICTAVKLIAIYITGHKAYTTYRNHTSIQRQFKSSVSQGGVFSPKLFNIYTADLPPPGASVQVMTYADDIIITSTHTSTVAAKKYIQPYLHQVFVWTNHNNLT